jgi:hypothetical protein
VRWVNDALKSVTCRQQNACVPDGSAAGRECYHIDAHALRAAGCGRILTSPHPLLRPGQQLDWVNLKRGSDLVQVLDE